MMISGRLILIFGLLLMASKKSEAVENYSEKTRPIILQVWKNQINKNKGIHIWNSDYDAMFVFQEWAAILADAKSKSSAEQKKVGIAFEKYVVEGKMSPTGKIGTSFPIPGYTDGDFDMSLLGAISILGLYQEDRVLLTDATLVYLIKNVVQVWGQRPKSFFDVFFLAFHETENHIFMSESTRFLTNQWVFENPRQLPEIKALRDSLERDGIVVDNATGELKKVLLKNMQSKLCKGFFEFNAQIYQRFTIHALDNLYSFSGDHSIQMGAGCLLDYLSATFTFQSFASLRYGPYRRSSEIFQDSNLIRSDATCSFFAAQSGKFPWDIYKKNSFWDKNISHASLALFSTLLKYRVPNPILDLMVNRPESYRAEIYSAYSGKGGGEKPSEIYLGGKNYLLTAGGNYERYGGINFPTFKFGMKKSPWVYDIVTRSGSLIINPLEEKPQKLADILHFHGTQWQSHNLSLHGNVLYGFAEKEDKENPQVQNLWPQAIPKKWMKDSKKLGLKEMQASNQNFDFQFIDQSKNGIYIILSRIHPDKTFFHWDYQNYSRGTVEVVETNKVSSLKDLKERFLALNVNSERPLEDHRDLIYVDFRGDKIHLNTRYDGKNEGILAVEGSEKFSQSESSEELAGVLNPQYLWDKITSLHKKSHPLFKVESLIPGKGLIALANGEGEMQVSNSNTKGLVKINFRDWWNPERIVIDSSTSLSISK